MRKCDKCGISKSLTEFAPSTSYLWPTGRIAICFPCVESWLDGDNLNEVDRFMQYCNMAFLPNEWRKLWKREKTKAWRKYCAIYNEINYYKYDWGEQNEKLMELAKSGVIEGEVEELKEDLVAKLKLTWGDLPPLDLMRLESFYNTSLSDYGAQTAPQKDLLRKLAQTSIMVDEQLKEGEVNKDLFNQYEKTMSSVLKTFQAVDTNAITAVGQIIEFIERNGYKPTFYEGVPRDEIDMLEKNIQEYLRDLVQSEVNLTDLFEKEKIKRGLGQDIEIEGVDWEPEEENNEPEWEEWEE